MFKINRLLTARVFWRFATSCLCIPFLVYLPNGVCLAQNVGPVPDLALHLSPQFIYDQELGTYHSHLYYARIASSTQVAPGKKSTGVVETVFLRAGVRTQNFETFDFRWRAGLLNMDFIRTPFATGVTLLDFNYSGLREVDVTWVNLRFGPSLYLGNPNNYVTIRAVGMGGINTVEMGSFSFEGLAARDELRLRKRSYEVGYLGEIQVFLARAIQLTGEFKYRHLLGGIRPQLYSLSGSLGVKVTTASSILISYTTETNDVDPFSLNKTLLGIAVGILF